MINFMQSQQKGRTSRKKSAKAAGNKLLPSDDTPHRSHSTLYSSFLQKYNIPLILFLFSLFFLITFSNPALFLTDEWITVNQVHQMDIGHQIVVNEGKYGVYTNGTPTNYFAARNNLLMYPLMLPLLSMPVIKLMSLLGDQFRLAIIILWALLPILIALLISSYHPRFAHIHGVNIVNVGIAVGFIGLIVNLIIYTPFVFHAADAPIESAAVVLTNHILFASLVVIIFYIFREIFSDIEISLYGTFACLGCSSYLFWAGNAKDHILVTVLFALVILFLIRYLTDQSFINPSLAFIFAGLLIWERPELGITVYLFSLIFFCACVHNKTNINRTSLRGIFLRFLPPFFVIIGIIPMFINNLIVNGDFLMPSYLVANPVTPSYSIQQVITRDPVLSVVNNNGANSVGGLVNSVQGYFIIHWSTLPQDIWGVFFSPLSGNMSLFSVTPFLLIALVILPVLWYYRVISKKTDQWMILLMGLMTVSVGIAYISSFSILNADRGIMPDMRYLSPIYIPAGILGIYCIRMIGMGVFTPLRTLLRTIGATALLVPTLFILIVVFQPFGEFSKGYVVFFRVLIYSETILLIITLVLSKLKQISWKYTESLVILLIATIFSWQMMMLFFYSVGKFNGYPFWIPFIHQIYHGFIDYTIISR